MNDENGVEQPISIIPMSKSDFMGVLILGAVTGLIVWGLGMLFNRFIFDVYLCQGEVSTQCGGAKDYSAVTASLIAAIAALAGLIRLRVYRPLLVLIASMFGLWKVAQISWDLNTFIGLAVVIVLYALAFGVFAWLARIRTFWLSLSAVVLLVVAVRIAMVL